MNNKLLEMIGISPAPQIIYIPKMPYWFFLTIEECPVCGERKITQEKRVTEKPADRKDRVFETSGYCGCLGDNCP